MTTRQPKHDLTQLDYDKHLQARQDKDRHEAFHRVGNGQYRRRMIHRHRNEFDLEDI